MSNADILRPSVCADLDPRFTHPALFPSQPGCFLAKRKRGQSAKEKRAERASGDRDNEVIVAWDGHHLLSAALSQNGFQTPPVKSPARFFSLLFSNTLKQATNNKIINEEQRR